jgi:long-subunit acyl-CoA synthetase (AMP-forming)
MSENFYKNLKKKVREKYKTKEKIEWWFMKFNTARRKRTAKLSEQQNHRCCYCGGYTFFSENDRN